MPHMCGTVLLDSLAEQWGEDEESAKLKEFSRSLKVTKGVVERRIKLMYSQKFIGSANMNTE